MITNEPMKPGRWPNISNGRKLYRRITDTLNAGLPVQISTPMRSWLLDARHVPHVILGRSGSVYLQHGKQKDCIDYCAIRFGVQY